MVTNEALWRHPRLWLKAAWIQGLRVYIYKKNNPLIYINTLSPHAYKDPVALSRMSPLMGFRLRNESHCCYSEKQ